MTASLNPDHGFNSASELILDTAVAVIVATSNFNRPGQR